MRELVTIKLPQETVRVIMGYVIFVIVVNRIYKKTESSHNYA